MARSGTSGLRQIAILTHSRRRALRHGAILGGLIFFAYVVLVLAPVRQTMGHDAVAYWVVDLPSLYRGSYTDFGFFPYSPAAALVMQPLAWLSWPAFAVVWWGLMFGALAWLGRRDFLLLLAFPPVASEVYHGNIHLLLAVAMVLGFRYPAAWSAVLLTKVTSGVALLWFAARGEWRQLGVALGVTAVIALATFVLLPAQWIEWATLLFQNAGGTPPWPGIPIPLWIRLPLAALIVIWGARRDARWTVPVAATLALPVLWIHGLAMLVACWPLRSNTGPREE